MKTSTLILIVIIAVITCFALYILNILPLNGFLFSIFAPVVSMLTVEMLYTKKEEDEIDLDNQPSDKSNPD